MIRFHCPHCRAAHIVADDRAGQPTRCKKCGKGVEVPHATPPQSAPDRPAEAPPPLAELEPAASAGAGFDPFPTVADDGPPRPPRRGWGLALAIAASLLVLLMAYALWPGDDGPNARCPFCEHAFQIPEEHRGNPVEANRTYACPNCGISSRADLLSESKRQNE
jgi:hypothetical protein